MPQPPDRGPHTRLEVKAPPEYTQVTIGNKPVFVSQAAYSEATAAAEKRKQFVEKRISERVEEAKRMGKNNVGDAHIEAANDIATSTERILGYKPSPEEIEAAKREYLNRRREPLINLATRNSNDPQKRETAKAQLGTLAREGRASSILYHLSRVAALKMKTAKDVLAKVDPNTCALKPDGEQTFVNYITAATTLAKMEKELLVRQIRRRVFRAEQAGKETARQSAYQLILEVLFDPRQYKARLGVHSGMLTPEQLRELGVKFTQRYSNFARGTGNPTPSNMLEADKKSRDQSLKLVKSGRTREQDAVAFFCVNHGIEINQGGVPIDQFGKPLPQEIQKIIKTTNLIELQMARLATYRGYDRQHQKEIEEAIKLYQKQTRTYLKRWQELAQKNGWIESLTL